MYYEHLLYIYVPYKHCLVFLSIVYFYCATLFKVVLFYFNSVRALSFLGFFFIRGWLYERWYPPDSDFFNRRKNA